MPPDKANKKGTNTRKVEPETDDFEGAAVFAERQRKATSNQSEVRGRRRATKTFKSTRRKEGSPESDRKGGERPRRPDAALVRETRASRLRAATKVSALEAYSPSHRSAAANVNSKSSAPASTAKTRLNKLLPREGVRREGHVSGAAESLSYRAHCEKPTLSECATSTKLSSSKKGDWRRGQVRVNIKHGCPGEGSSLGSGEVVTDSTSAESSKSDGAGKAREAKTEPKSAASASTGTNPGPRESWAAAAGCRAGKCVAEKNVPSNAPVESGRNTRPVLKDVFVQSNAVAVDSASDQEKPSKHGKASILKGKPEFVAPADCGVEFPTSKPISILKRRSVPQEENAQVNYSPVTFSPSVAEKENDPKRQGILKKRRSLDECEVLEKQTGSVDSRPILKNQRRSSAEDSTRRTRSLDSAFPQGILKRKPSREEEPDVLSGRGTGSASEPQGILKKKPAAADRGGTVTAPVVEQPRSQPPEIVRPILKKKSLSEELSSGQHPLAEVPKSILKKKLSLDGEEADERPKKPILKITKNSSAEEADNPGQTDPPRPILKREVGTGIRTGPGPDPEPGGPFRLRARPGRRSFSDAEDELSAAFSNSSSSSVRPFDSSIFHRGQLKRSCSNDALLERIPGSCWNLLDRDRAPHQERCIRADSRLASPPLRSPVQARDPDAGPSTALDVATGEKRQLKWRSEFPGSREVLPAVAVPVPASDEFFFPFRGHSMRLDGSAESPVVERKSAATLKLEPVATDEKEMNLGRESKTGRRRMEKKMSEGSARRFHTRPASPDDLKLARTLENETPPSPPPVAVAPAQPDDGRQHQDELSSMSYSERVRLFESALSPRTREPAHRSRVSRFCTQPVTATELEVAKSLKQCRGTAPSRDRQSPENPDDGKIILKSQAKRQGKSPLTLELENVLRQAGGKRSIDRSAIDPKQRKCKSEKDHPPVLSSFSGEAAATGVTATESELLDSAARLARSRNSSTIVKSQSHSAVSTDIHATRTRTARSLVEDVGEGAESRPLRKSGTQPLEEAEDPADDEDMSGATIQERLARLKKNGELGWQKRKRDASHSETLHSASSRDVGLSTEAVRSSVRGSAFPSEEGEPSRRRVLADRLVQLDAASQGWKRRIQPSDAGRFSVEGKMGVRNIGSLARQERQKRCPKAKVFSSGDPSLHLAEAPSPHATEAPARDVGVSSSSCPSPGGCDVTRCSVVSVPKIDDETFTSFYGGLERIRVPEDPLEIKDEDLNAVAPMKSSQLLVQKKDVKRQKRRAAVRNPVKSLAARLDSQEYTEMMTGVAQMELGRMKWGRGDRSTSLAIEALAGLASQEDFTSVTLKKAAEGSGPFPDAPYKDLMLLQVKGRRHVQTRLVEPVAASVNAGDCFILVAGNKIFHYVGKFANVIERCRGAEISSHIQQKGDLGCSAQSVVTLGDASKATRAQVDEFWKLLGGEAGCERDAGDPDEDEIFEASLVDTNMVYEMVGTELVPNEACWGTAPRIGILDPNKILVFDFGSEFYVWNGKNASLANRRLAIRLGKELWKEGYNYLECSLCPITAASFAGSRRSGGLEVPVSAKTGSTRPPWTLFAKITQNMETVLFREKFLDWPVCSKVTGKSRKEEESEGGERENEDRDDGVGVGVGVGDVDDEKVNAGQGSWLKTCNPREMLETVVPLPDLVLEGTHLGRGLSYYDQETRRRSEIATRDVTVWHINEFEHSKISSASVGQFHTGDSYVVRWYYTVTVTGRELSGQPSRHLTTGRDRYAYFCWQGQNSPINEKGAAACLTVELDKENGPQVRVCQGSEPPAFLNLFRGRMVVHEGKRASRPPRRTWRLFFSRGETESESVLFEVPCSGKNLRSAASFVMVNAAKGRVVVWHGSNSSQLQRMVAVTAAEKIQRRTPEEFGFESVPASAAEVNEGDEPEDISQVLGPRPQRGSGPRVIGTPRLFYLSSLSGDFHASEVASPYLGAESPTPFPFQQSDLYSASQPALFLLDAGPTLWLWQGWWEESSESDRGSGSVRFQAERRAAMSTAIAYWHEKHGANGRPEIYSIWAGLEPALFTSLFPSWTDRDDVAAINAKEGKKPGDMAPVNDELDNLTRSFYPLSQLQNRPLPDGVNPNSLEEYLNPQSFQDLFGIDRKEFHKLPSWKKKKLKQEFGLF